LQGLVPLPDESRDLFFRACRDSTATTHGLRCMAAPFDRCTAYFGAPFHTHTLGCGQTIVVRLTATLEARSGLPRSVPFIHVIPAIPPCPARPKTGHSDYTRICEFDRAQ